MQESVRLHLWRFACLFLLGAGIEAVVETYAVFRGLIHFPRFVRAFADGLFSFALITGSAFALFFINGGDLRLYVIIGMSLGFSLCRATLGPTFRKVLAGSLDAAMTFGRKLRQTLLSPTRRTSSQFLRPIAHLIRRR